MHGSVEQIAVYTIHGAYMGGEVFSSQSHLNRLNYKSDLFDEVEWIRWRLES